MKRCILAIVSDLHSGHRYGLLSPETVLEEIDENGDVVGDYHPKLNKVQTYLWKLYTTQIESIGKYANGDEIVVILNGDLTAGVKYPQMLVSDRVSDQVIIGEYNVYPWYSINPTAVRVIKGTGAHNLNFGSSEITITRMLQHKFPETNTKVVDHSLLNLGGMNIDAAHHGPYTGSRTWLKGNVARYYLQSSMLEEIAAGKHPPRLYIRSHYHEEIEESVVIKANGNRYKSTIIVTPSFCFIDDHARQVARSPSRVTHGMAMIEIVDGEILRYDPMIRTIDIRTKEKI